MATGRTLAPSPAASTMPPTVEGGLRLGRLRLDATISPPSLVRDLELIFKQCWVSEPLDAVDGVLTMRHALAGDAWPVVPSDGLMVTRGDEALSISSEVVDARLDTAASPFTIDMRVRAERLAPHETRVHLSIAWHRLLLALGAVYLHAAAVTIDGRTHVFIGEKGAGKSTLSLALAQAGGTVLSDDHVLIERRKGGYVVSGCEARSRVTADAEAHLFATPLPIVAEDFAGTPKKEFALADYVSAAPFEARPIDALHFPAVGDTLTLTPRPAQASLLDLLRRTKGSFRPQHASESGELLDFWSGLIHQAPAFDLELSPTLASLASLPQLLAR